jgi:spore protease
MHAAHTDLALESAELLGYGGQDFSRIPGVHFRESHHEGYRVTTIYIRSREGEYALGRPRGRYATIDLRPVGRRSDDFFRRGVRCLSSQLRRLLPRDVEQVLVVGLGNRDMTPDAVGPLTLDSLLITRHMGKELPQLAGVAALAPGVLSQTGMESETLAACVVQQLRPQAVIAVDALAARSRERLCRTIQLCDTGLTPGSGVGNRRAALDRKTLGVPVIAVGIPTVIRADTLAAETAGADPRGTSSGHAMDPGGSLFVTPRDIDSRVRELSRLLGYGITLALQPSLTVDDVTGLLG